MPDIPDRTPTVRETVSPESFLVLLHPNMSEILGRVAEMLASGLRRLSYQVKIVNKLPADLDHKIVVLGATHFEESDLMIMPRGSIILNVENTASAFFTPSYVRLLRKYVVWDYDKTNSVELASMIARPVHHLKMFYAEELVRVADVEDRDIDVLFYGSFNSRRSAVLDKLREGGLSVKAVFGIYGDELDRLISRSKVVINIRFYPNGRLEMVRIFDLLINSRVVVSELGDGETVDEDLTQGLVVAPYNELAQVVAAMVRDPNLRADVAAAGEAALKRRCAKAILREAIDWSAKMRIPDQAVIGSGKLYDPSLFNIDIDARWHPDIAANIADSELFAKEFSSKRFGQVKLQRGQFDCITASHVLEHIPDLVSAMTNCLDLLCEGGLLRVAVPYDLSYGAWQDPTHVHAFNERSWLYYCEWCWYLGWSEARFELLEERLVYSPVGESLKGIGRSDEEIRRTPRAVDEMQVVLRKRALTEEERNYGKAMHGQNARS